MSKFLDSIEASFTGNVVGIDNDIDIRSTIKEANPITDRKFTVLNTYRIQVTVGQFQNCKPSELDLLLKNFRKELSYYIYEDLIKISYELRRAIYARDFPSALKNVNVLLNRME